VKALVSAERESAGDVPLRRLQAWFLAVATDPHGPALDDDLRRLVTPGPALSAFERVEIYAEGYRARLVECLADDYPALRYVLGIEAFEAFARDYVAAHPSRSPSLNAYGKHFAAFCRRSAAPWAPFAAELARLEWALVEAVHAPSTSRFEPRALASVPGDAWNDVRFVASPTLRVLRFRYPVNAFFQSFREGREPTLPELGESAVAVHREELALTRLELSGAAASVLERLVDGTPLGRVLAELEASVADPAELAETLRAIPRWFETWTASGFFSGIDLGRGD
jgi:hypothetical protein